MVGIKVMNVLITGGTGFIGSQLALRLLGEGHSVRVLGQTNNEYEEQNADLLAKHGATIELASVTERNRIFALLEGIDWVFHFAAAQHEANVPDQHFHDVNVAGTKNLLEASIAAGVQRFVHGSTIGVYGEAGEHTIANPITETSPVNPANIYGETKLEGEKLVIAHRDKLPVVVIRISEVYGPGDQRLLKLFKGVQKGMFFKIGPGRNLHHLIYVDDLLDGLMLAATQDKGLGEVFVLSGPDPLTTDEMIETVAAGLNVALPPARAPLGLFMSAATAMEAVFKPLGIQPPLHRRRMDFFRKSFVLSSDKAAKVLGFQPKYRFDEGVIKTADWYAEQGLLKATNGTHSHAQLKAPAHEITGRIMNGSANGGSPNGASNGAIIGDDDGHGSVHKPSAGEAFSTAALSARIEQFDSFWEGPEDIEKGYSSFGDFYRENYLPYMPKRRDLRVLSISCGPGYFVKMLKDEGYTNVLGIDSEYDKVQYAPAKGLNCIVANAVEFLQGLSEPFDVIVCEQELNHLTKEEMVQFLQLCYRSLRSNGSLLVHGLNGANPLTGSDASAQNFDHFNTFTEYSLQQVMEYSGFGRVRTFPLNLFVFYNNPLNYVGLIASTTLSLLFRAGFMLYGKKNKIFTKKIGAVGVRVE